jgi:hypothetical protein
MTKGLFDRLQDELEAREKAAGLSLADVLMLPDPQRQLVNWMMDQEQMSLAAVMAHTGEPEEAVRRMLGTLVEKGFLREMEVAGESRYQIRFARKRGASLPLNIWQALDEKLKD